MKKLFEQGTIFVTLVFGLIISASAQSFPPQISGELQGQLLFEIGISRKCSAFLRLSKEPKIHFLSVIVANETLKVFSQDEIDERILHVKNSISIKTCKNLADKKRRKADYLMFLEVI